MNEQCGWIINREGFRPRRCDAYGIQEQWTCTTTIENEKRYDVRRVLCAHHLDALETMRGVEFRPVLEDQGFIALWLLVVAGMIAAGTLFRHQALGEGEAHVPVGGVEILAQMK